MANNFFRFKQFVVYQNDEVLKVSTDSVLLGAWIPAGNYKKVLDIGTGTGLLALMTAQRFSQATIDAVEIDLEACNIAEKNFRLSPFTEQIKLFEISVQKFSAKYPENCYDLIITNPPYFKNQKPSASKKKNIQKHSCYLSPDELAGIAKKHLSENGIFALIFPQEEGRNFIATARFHGLYCRQITEVFVRPSQKTPKRLLLLFSNTAGNLNTNKLFLEDGNRNPAKEYKKLTSGFYSAL